MPSRLLITEDSYSLLQEDEGTWRQLAVLAGGARTLMPGRVDEASLEAAIQAAEDWLMPHAARLRGQDLEVIDSTGRLNDGLRELLSTSPGTWRVEDVEAWFLRLVDLTTGRWPSAAAVDRAAFVADVLLLRELAHHGRLGGIVLSQQA
jgi:hypothetical protein